MSKISLIIAPNPIFRQKAEKVTSFDDELINTVEAMFDVLYHHNGVGLGANMVGLLKRIIVIDLQENGQSKPISMINPEIISQSEETQTYTEASLSYPGISAPITRPKTIKVKFQKLDASEKIIDATGWLSSVIQHEIDYLNGQTYLDHLSKLKKNSLLKKMKKHIKTNS